MNSWGEHNENLDLQMAASQRDFLVLFVERAEGAFAEYSG